MATTQMKIFWVIVVIGLVYFAAFCFPNTTGAKSESMLRLTSTDEPVTYPTVVRMLSLGSTFKQTFSNFVYYADYHYGYPFYLYSALVVLPVRVIAGPEFGQRTQINLLLLRQFVSVLPMLLAAGLLVYLQTRFKSFWLSVGLFLFLLTIRGVIRNDLRWWHPDAMAILAAMLTIFFLDRDRLRFGRNFGLAAMACGLATAIKLIGAFFGAAIPAVLVAGVATRRIRPVKALAAGAVFVGLMGITMAVTNPFLINREARQELVNTQQIKAGELANGYTHDDPKYYQKSPAWWEPTLQTWYGNWFFLGFLLVSLLAGCVWGNETFVNRLILLWVVPYTLYLFYFVAPKPDHYFLPVMLPLFSAAFNLLGPLWQAIRGRAGNKPMWARALAAGITVLVVVLFGAQMVANVTRPSTGIVQLYSDAFRETGLEE